jgi:hypothetical protein
MVAHTCNPISWKPKSTGSQFQSQSGYTDHISKTKNKTKQKSRQGCSLLSFLF